MKQMLGRRYNPNTACWEKVGVVPIPAEKMDEVLRPKATVLDLLALLIWCAERNKD